MKKSIWLGGIALVFFLSMIGLIGMAGAASVGGIPVTCTSITGTGTTTDTIGSGAPNVAGNNVDVVFGLITASQSGTLQSIGVDMVSGGNGEVAVALYSDSGGQPGTLLAQSADVATIASGWQDVPITGVSIVAGTSYYLAEEFSSSSDTWYYIGSSTAWYYPYTTFGVFPTAVTWISNPNIIETRMTYTGATTLDGVPVTAALVATTGTTITSTVDATGCGVGIYVDPTVTGVTITAKVSNAQLAGIYVNGGKADVIGSTVSKIGDTPFDGVQYGWGILYDSGATGKVINTKVSAYQKAGIKVIDPNTNVIVSGDTITGLGPVAFIAQNGVEFVSGASGSVKDSTISGNSYTGTGTPACDTENYFTACDMSAGILLYDAAPSVVVSNNRVSSSDMGMAAYSDGTVPASAKAAYVVSNNILQNNYGYGLIFDSFNGISANNNFQSNLVGLLVTDSSSNAFVTSINDQFMNNAVNNEAIDAGSTYHENLVVETTGRLPYPPFPGFPHAPHFPHRG